jgi:hypothetical protein
MNQHVLVMLNFSLSILNLCSKKETQKNSFNLKLWFLIKITIETHSCKLWLIVIWNPNLNMMFFNEYKMYT